MNRKEALAIIDHYYNDFPELKQLLLNHSESVCRKALEIINRPECAGITVDRQLVECGALLHDIGIVKCHAPGILCTGTLPYIAHGIAGAEMLMEYGSLYHTDMEKYAGICSRHTGSGLTAQEIAAGNIPLPHQDYLPESTEEKLICLADKFFSKSGNMREKPFDRVRTSMAKFGNGPLERFDILCREFKLHL